MTHMLEVVGLTKSFTTGRTLLGRPTGGVDAVRGVDLSVGRGETVAVVGESGAGKSTLGRLILRLIEPDAGAVRLDGVDVLALSRRELRTTRKRMQMIFQDPFSSLDPRMTVEDSVGEQLTIHFGLKGRHRRREVLDLFDRVGIAEGAAERYPHEFSGGQLQRLAIARALAAEPDLIVCDEPVAALDVSIRAQVINLLQDLQEERGVAYVFISHDLSLVRLISDRVAVMYRGQIVEEAVPDDLYNHPRHPYTRALLEAIPIPDPRERGRLRSAAAASPMHAASGSTGCAYAQRCPESFETCWSLPPSLVTDGGGRRVSCHLETPSAPVRAGPEDRPVNAGADNT